MEQKNQLWIVLVIVVLFLGAGFTYKYTLSPSAMEKKNASIPSENMRGSVSPSSSGVTFIPEIGADPGAVPPPIKRTQNTTVKYALNKQVPAPMMRVMEGDTVEVSLFHNPAGHSHAQASVFENLGISLTGPFTIETAHAESSGGDPHAAGGGTGHATHSVDLHAVLGPGGGAGATQAKDGDTKTFSFQAMRPGLYVYHCASPHIPTHIANGMYGLILVEPKGGLPAVDREYYMMQGEFYTAGKRGETGLQAFSLEKMDAEHPEYVVFNGRVGSLTGARALKSKVGESVRIFFGVGTYLPSNFHVIQQEEQ
jgi:nitrite reductase (NO-forming)